MSWEPPAAPGAGAGDGLARHDANRMRDRRAGGAGRSADRNTRCRAQILHAWLQALEAAMAAEAGDSAQPRDRAPDLGGPARQPLRRAVVEAVARRLENGAPPSPDGLGVLRDVAAAEAAAGTPLDDLLAACTAGGRAALQCLLRSAADGDGIAALGLVAEALDHLQAVEEAVRTAYKDDWLRSRSARDDARRALAAALVAGRSTTVAAARAGYVVASAYALCALRLRRPPRSAVELPGALDLVTNLHPGVLYAIHSTDLVLLVPAATDGELPGAVLDAAHQLARRARTRVAVVPAASPAHLPVAVAAVRELLAVASSLGRPAGTVYRGEDLALELALARDPSASRQLVGMLEAIAEGPDLVATLEAFYREDLDRSASAASLHIHPSTLDYRLGRIRALAGVDPTTTDGIRTLSAALLGRLLLPPAGRTAET